MKLEALHKISYGLYVVSSGKKENRSGQIANTVFQATSEPPTIAVCINKKNFTHRFIQETGFLAITVLSKRTPLEFIGRFGFKSGRDIDKFEGVSVKIGKTGVPIVLNHGIAYFEAKVIREFEGGTHTIFIGKLVDAEILSDEEPITYAYYHEIKRGVTPETAPTYIKEENKGGDIMTKYRCTVCGYIYDPEKGDQESGIPPRTPFEELPDTWICPVCGATKDQFEKVS